MKRRTMLEALAGVTATAVVFARGCDSMHSTRLDRDPADVSPELASHLHPLVYSELSLEHRRLVVSTSGDAEVRVCPPVPLAVTSFIALAERRIDRQHTEYPGDTDDAPRDLWNAFVEDDGELYRLWIGEEDVVISG